MAESTFSLYNVRTFPHKEHVMRTRVTTSLCLLVIGSALAARTASGAGIVLVKEGRANATIVYPMRPEPPGADASEERRHQHERARRAQAAAHSAAERLQVYLKRITGADLPMAPDTQRPAGSLILVGDTVYTRGMGIDAGKLPGDSFVMRVKDNCLALAGNSSVFPNHPYHPVKQGTLFAISTFLEDYCGVRWFMPGAVGEDVLPRKTITVPSDLDRFEQASVAFRWLKADVTWRWHNKVDSSFFAYTGGGHTWDVLVPTAKYEKTHPEYYALVRGKRASQIEKGHDASLCTSNPKALQVAIETVRRHFDMGYDVFELGHPDSFGGDVKACECPVCMKVADTSQEGLSRRVYVFHAKIAEAVRKSHPGKYVQFVVYGPTSQPPADFEGFPDNVIALVASPSEERLFEWSKYVSAPFVYTYNWTNHKAIGVGPKSHLRRIMDEMDRWRRYNVKGIYWCGSNNNWGLDGVQYWLVAKLMWDQSLNPHELLDDYFSRFYRQAEKPMRVFFAVLGKCQAVHIGQKKGGGRIPSSEWYRNRYTPGALEKMAGYLAEAKERAADDPLVLRRIALTERCFTWLRLTAESFHLEHAFNSSQSSEDLESLADKVKAREDFIRRTLAKQEKGGYRDFVEVFIRGARPFPGEVLWGAESRFSGPFRLEFNKILAFMKEHGIPSMEFPGAIAAPKIDGNGADACWKAAKSAVLFCNRSGGRPEAGTEVLLTRDHEKLYVLFQCGEPKIDKLQAAPEKTEAKVWLADCVEIFLSPDPGGEPYYHFMLSWENVKYDSRKGFIDDPLDPLVFKEDTRWAPRWEARATVAPDRKMWVAEIAIPFRELGGAPSRSAKWRMNFCRERWIGEPRGPWDPKELSAWSPTFREFDLPARFGTVTFR